MAMATVMVVLGLLAMAVQPSMQQILKKPGSAFKIHSETPAYGLIASSSNTEAALDKSGIFTVESHVDIEGRRFVMGKILDWPVVYVNTANRPAVHAGITTHIMASNFNLRGIIVMGSAGGVNNSLNIGDVVIPGRIANTGIWTWKRYGATSNGQLVFGRFNTPENGENLLGSVEFGSSEVYENGELAKSRFWIVPDARYLMVASNIEFAETSENCLHPRKLGCLAAKNKVVTGLRASSSDVYVQNNAYREFLWHTFHVSTVDTTSHAVALGAMSSNLRFISFRGVSNTAGASEESNSALANANLVKAVFRFIYLDNKLRYDEE
ncbi:hypothetical protein JCGZ_08881 [Jatropha curcas]|uniref:Nucleoside phosphorylase domain-containing protein n=1 Tax=Jatropha curcas TaxID=180498 RepID=A0A067KNP8_JATCU|nr:bark storage protein A [Jatropha curcas]KDP36628.1 hypothetical protein JCGZ_08881 [Jatropha curcas]